jgi:hypothetical protein
LGVIKLFYNETADLVLTIFSDRIDHEILENLFIFALVIGLISLVDACGDERRRTVKPKIAGDFTYITDGIGICEALMMRDLADDYPFDGVFIKILGQREESLANVKVRI